MSRFANTPFSCKSCADTLLITGPILASIPWNSHFSLGTVPVSPQRIGALRKLTVSNFLSTSAFA